MMNVNTEMAAVSLLSVWDAFLVFAVLLIIGMTLVFYDIFLHHLRLGKNDELIRGYKRVTSVLSIFSASLAFLAGSYYVVSRIDSKQETERLQFRIGSLESELESIKQESRAQQMTFNAMPHEDPATLAVDVPETGVALVKINEDLISMQAESFTREMERVPFELMFFTQSAFVKCGIAFADRSKGSYQLNLNSAEPFVTVNDGLRHECTTQGYAEE